MDEHNAAYFFAGTLVGAVLMAMVALAIPQPEVSEMSDNLELLARRVNHGMRLNCRVAYAVTRSRDPNYPIPEYCDEFLSSSDSLR